MEIRKRGNNLTIEQLLAFCEKHFKYQEGTGQLLLKERRGFGDTLSVGDEIGTIEKRDGYRVMSIKDKQYKVHRIVWLMVYKSLPKTIDHIDGDKLNNRLINLRDVNTAQQNKNKGLQRNNKSGCAGVRFHKPTSKWRAQIGVGGRNVELGAFIDVNDAIAVRKAAEVKYGYGEDSIVTPKELVKPPRTNKLGIVGVYFDEPRNRYSAQIAHDGVRYNLGRYADIEDAIKARRDAEDSIRINGYVTT